MYKFVNCSTVAELIKKSRKMIQIWIKTFINGTLEAIAPSSPSGRASSLSEEQRESLKADVITHPRELGYEFSNWEGKNVAHHIK